MISTTRRTTAALAALALLGAACAGAADESADTEPAASDTADTTDEESTEATAEDADEDGDGDGDRDGDDHGDADAPGVVEVSEPSTRLVVTDADDFTVRVIDLATAEVLATFELEHPARVLTLGSQARMVALAQPDGDVVQFLDGGTFGVDHGDHPHYYVTDPALLDATLTTDTPIHTTSSFGSFAIFSDGTGTGYRIDEGALANGRLEVATLETGAPNHGGTTLITDTLWSISGPADGQDGGLVDEVWVFDGDARVGTFDCPGLHGERPGASWTGYACADRILLLQGHGDHADAREIAYPADLGDDFRLGYLASAWDSDVFASTRGDRLLLVDADAGDLQVIELPADAATRAVVDDDGHLLVLTDDGVLHQFDPASGELVASSEPVITIDDGDDAPSIALAGGRDRAYVTSPSEGIVHEFATNDGLRLTRTMEIGGSPTGLVYLGGWPR